MKDKGFEAMKKVLLFISALLILLSSTSCSKKIQDVNTTNNQIEESESFDEIYNISLYKPIIMSLNYLEEQDIYLLVVLKKGSYKYDFLTEQQIFWEGEYYLQVYNGIPDDNNLLSETRLQVGASDILSFSGEFILETDDYNNDGNIDFTIGQRIGSNGSEYQIYTISKDGEVSILPIDDTNNLNRLYIASSLPSVQLEKTGDLSFSYEYYDQNDGKFILKKRIWDGAKFILEKETN